MVLAAQQPRTAHAHCSGSSFSHHESINGDVRKQHLGVVARLPPSLLPSPPSLLPSARAALSRLPSNSLLGLAKDGRGSASGAPPAHLGLLAVQKGSGGFYPERLLQSKWEWTGLGDRGTPVPTPEPSGLGNEVLEG